MTNYPLDNQDVKRKKIGKLLRKIEQLDLPKKVAAILGDNFLATTKSNNNRYRKNQKL